MEPIIYIFIMTVLLISMSIMIAILSIQSYRLRSIIYNKSTEVIYLKDQLNQSADRYRNLIKLTEDLTRMEDDDYEYK